ncbi:MAG: M28 family peptidase [Alphaproteobacteria bacterium]|nr:MAG: M28 family peptidase [Alphaproteobacteria bacterium]
MVRYFLVFLGILVGFNASALAEEQIDLDVINQIRDEGFNHSEVVETLRHLTDEIGPRLTGSPQMKAANDWTLAKFEEWGLKNGTLQPYEFGRGWTVEKSHVRMITPRADQLYAFPFAWTVGTGGPISGEVVLAKIESEEDFENYQGQLEGKIVFFDEADYWNEPSNNVFHRLTDEELEEAKDFPLPGEKVKISAFEKRINLIPFRIKRVQFLKQEGALAIIRLSRREAHLLEPSAYLFGTDNTFALPIINMASEHYNRIVRLVENKRVVELEIDIATTFYDDDPMAYNTIAEIPGEGRNPEIVMAGAHLDSWFIGDGAVDNGAGSAVVMEAMRILASLPGFKPKRTIRAALWSGEEQCLCGAFAYVRENFADRPIPEGLAPNSIEFFFKYKDNWPITTKPDHARFSAYFNVDNGSGKIRGIYSQGNVATAEIFRAWFKPFHDLGAKTVVTRPTGGTDHLAFQLMGLPAYQFIQDPLDYGARLHHTQLDTFDHIVPEDLKQASVILASFLYLAAMRDEPLPRKPLPKKPKRVPEEE